MSANVRAACAESGVRYLRLLREGSGNPPGRLFDSIPEMVEYLNASDKKALITTGGNSLAEYTKVRGFRDRLTVRILPAERTILEKGPFTVEQNVAHIKQAAAEILVTKESGAAGGFPEKAEAAALCSAELLTLRRPVEQGYSLTQTEKILETEIT